MDYLTPAPPAAPSQAGSLLAAANTPTAQLERTLNGDGFWAPACTGWRLYAPCADSDDFDDAVIDHGSTTKGSLIQGMPFPVQVFDDDCPNTFADRDPGTRVQDARARLARVESAAIAHEFWTGELATAQSWDDNPRLVSDDTTVVASGAALSVVGAIAALADALGAALAGAPGALHLTPGTLQYVDAAGITLTRQGFGIRTLTDHYVIADAGYAGTDPDGDAPADGEAWIYATARPTAYRSQVFTQPPVLNRAVNTMLASAEEYALVTVSCGVYAARVTLT